MLQEQCSIYILQSRDTLLVPCIHSFIPCVHPIIQLLYIHNNISHVGSSSQHPLYHSNGSLISSPLFVFGTGTAFTSTGSLLSLRR